MWQCNNVTVYQYRNVTMNQFTNRIYGYAEHSNVIVRLL